MRLDIDELKCSCSFAMFTKGEPKIKWVAGVQPCAPRLSFLDWYEYWLDERSDWWREFKY